MTVCCYYPQNFIIYLIHILKINAEFQEVNGFVSK